MPPAGPHARDSFGRLIPPLHATAEPMLPIRPLLLPFFAVAIAAMAHAQRQTVTIACTEDATLYEDPAGQLTNDGGSSVFAGKTAFGEIRRALLKFPTTAIPADAVVIDARLTLGLIQTPSLNQDPISIHRVSSAWTEGTTAAPSPGGGGTAAATGDTTWVYREYPSARWANLGGDFAAQASATTTVGFFQNSTFTMGPSAGMNADVQAWARGEPNHGWIVRVDETQLQIARRLGSRTNTNATLRPRLVVTYVPAGGTTQQGNGCAGSQSLPLLQTITGTPLRGASINLAVSQGSPNAAALTMLNFRLTTSASDFVPGCPFELESYPTENLGIVFLNGSGASNTALTIPNAAYLLGFSLAFQTIAIDQAFLPSQLVLSNGSLIVIG